MTSVVLELVVSTGDPQGIGPEVSIAAARHLVARDPKVACVLCGDPADPALAALPVVAADPATAAPGLWVLPTATPRLTPGPPPSAYGGAAALAAIDGALSRVRANPMQRALVTAPVSKAAVVASGVAFDGHTGYVARACGVADPVMLFVAPDFRVALATVHTPLKDVATLICEESLAATIRVVASDLERWFGLRRPRIHVLGVNPHAGEDGHIGREEVDVLIPVIRKLAGEGTAIEGPFPADSYFRSGFQGRSDVIVAMHHDQGLIPVKLLAFHDAVNVTLGLPIVRTSVDHGTAFDIAGRGVADPRSMVAALDLALTMLRKRARSG